MNEVISQLFNNRTSIDLVKEFLFEGNYFFQILQLFKLNLILKKIVEVNIICGFMWTRHFVWKRKIACIRLCVHT